MRQLSPFMASVILLATLASVLRADSNQSTKIPQTTGSIITSDSPIQLGTRYGRLIRLQHSGQSNGTLIATFESWPSPLAIYQSGDDGISWTKMSSVTETQYPGWRFKVEPDLFELPQLVGNLPAGTLLIAGNAEKAKGHQLEIYCSLDQGKTWSYRGMVDNNAATGLGLWEPRLDITKSGDLVCYYSDERQVPTYSQLIAERVSSDGGLTWGPEQYACAIPGGVQRPGMAVTTKLPNGQHVMSFECVNAGSGYPVHIKFSSDGVNWGAGPSDYGTPVQTAAGAYPGACPYIMWTREGGPNGTLIVGGRTLTNSRDTNRELFVNANLGKGPWTTIPSPVQWQGGAGLAGWSMGMIPTSDGKGIIQMASSTTNNNKCEMLVAREQLETANVLPIIVKN